MKTLIVLFAIFIVCVGAFREYNFYKGGINMNCVPEYREWCSNETCKNFLSNETNTFAAKAKLLPLSSYQTALGCKNLYLALREKLKKNCIYEDHIHNNALTHIMTFSMFCHCPHYLYFGEETFDRLTEELNMFGDPKCHPPSASEYAPSCDTINNTTTSAMSSTGWMLATFLLTMALVVVVALNFYINYMQRRVEREDLSASQSNIMMT